MTRYKLYNSVRQSLIKKFGFKPHQIKQVSFSYKLLQDLLNSYRCEYIIDNYCCHGEDFCCWQDVDSSWVRLSNRNEIKVNRVCFKSFKDAVKYIKKSNKDFSIYDRKMFLCERKGVVWVLIPLRDVCNDDFAFCFDKTKVLT